MKVQHRLRINVADQKGDKQQVLKSSYFKLPKRLFTFIFGDFCEVLVLIPEESVREIEIREVRGEDDG